MSDLPIYDIIDIRQRSSLFTDKDYILKVEPTTGRLHHVMILVASRPEEPSEYIEFFTREAQRFAYDFKCKFVSILDVRVNAFNETAILEFLVKEYKTPEKREAIHTPPVRLTD